MGVRGLETFIDRSCPEVLEFVDIAECANEYRVRTGKKPVLLVHNSATFVFMQNVMPAQTKDYIHLGQYKLFDSMLRQLLLCCNNNDIECKFFLSPSCSGLKEELWRDEHYEDLSKMSHIMEMLRRQEALKATYEIQYFGAKARMHMNYAIRMMGANFIQMGTSEWEISRYIYEAGVFGVLAQNSDFIIVEGIENYFSALRLNLKNFTTSAYRRNALASVLGLDESYLPLFATLCGSSPKRYIGDELIPFHALVLGRKDVDRVTARLKIQKISGWIHRNAERFQNEDGALDFVCRMTNTSKEVMQECVNSYKPSILVQNRRVESILIGDWADIIELANERHKFQAVNGNLLTIMLYSKFFNTCSIEILSCEEFPNSGMLLLKLRRRLYGILLKERPTNVGHDAVKEFIVSSPGSLDNPPFIQPLHPPAELHPGLLHLWGDSATVSEKLSLLVWSVSNQLPVEDLLPVPLNLRVPSLALFFLVNEVNSGIARWQVEAFVVHLVRLQHTTAEELEAMPLGQPFPKPLEVHFSSVYMNAWSHILTLDDACGNPLFNDIDNLVFFDGKLFHNVYHSIYNSEPRSANVDQLPDALRNDYNAVINFLY